MADDFESKIIEFMRTETKRIVRIPGRDKILLYLHDLFLLTGKYESLFCNAFVDEAVELLKNAVFLYEDGYFDCAFYSIRQAYETINSMLYLDVNSDKMNAWKSKKRFPMNNEIKKKLLEISSAYNELRNKISEYYEKCESLTKQANKIIHKQGFDTFYRIRSSEPGLHSDEIDLFVEYLNIVIGVAILAFIVIDPMSLARTDENIDKKISFDPMTEPADIGYFKNIGYGWIAQKLYLMEFYKNYTDYFGCQEEMLPAVYSVIREKCWNLDGLSEIESQLYLLNIYQRFMFMMLKHGIMITKFIFNGSFERYITSNPSNYSTSGFSSSELEMYYVTEDRFNQQYRSAFLSRVKILETLMLFEHNDQISCEDIEKAKSIEESFQTEYNELLSRINQ